jgi:hypothetical protein
MEQRPMKVVERDPRKVERMAAMREKSCLAVSKVPPRKNSGLRASHPVWRGAPPRQ